MSNEPARVTGHPYFEEILRKFLAYQLVQITKTAAEPGVRFIDDLFNRFGSDVTEQVRKWFIEHTNIAVDINYPRTDANNPSVSVVNANESEGPQPYLGDHGGYEVLGGNDVQASSGLKLFGEQVPDNRPRATQVRRVFSIPEKRTTQVYVQTGDQNTTLYLYTVVKALIVLNKIDFDKYAGARAMTYKGSDLQWNEQGLPQATYMKVMTLDYEMNFEVVAQPQTTISGIDTSFAGFFGGFNGG